MAYSDLITGVGARGNVANAEVTRRLDAARNAQGGGVGSTFGGGLRSAANASVRAVTNGAVVFDKSDASGSFDSKNYSYVFEANPELGDYIHQVGSNTQLDKVRGTLQQQLEQRQQQIDALKAQVAAAGTSGGGPNGAPSPEANQLSQQLAALEQQQATTHGQLATTDLEAAKASRTQIEVALKTRYAAGAALPSFADSGIDPMSVEPKNKAEAEAFVQRLTIDMGVGVAELDYLKAQIDVAKYDMAHNGATTGDTQEKLQQLLTAYRTKSAVLVTLTKKYEQQKGYVGHLVDTYETRTGHQVDGSPLPADVKNETPEEKAARIDRGIEGVRELNDQAATGNFHGYDQIVASGIKSEILRMDQVTKDLSDQRVAENADFERMVARLQADHVDRARSEQKHAQHVVSERRSEQQQNAQHIAFEQYMENVRAQHARETASRQG